MTTTRSDKGVPVVLIVYRRPETTRLVFSRIAEARPAQLFVIADGPRSPAEYGTCELTRAETEEVNWPCSVVRDYSNTNLGLRKRVLTGLSHVFETVDQAIILEDDCFPHPTFFRFAEVLLEQYRNEAQVAHISGDNFLRRAKIREDYYFTRYAHVWGWATWKRAWQAFDPSLSSFQSNDAREQFLSDFSDLDERKFWSTILSQLKTREIDSWAYSWAISNMAQKALAINPSNNLVHNIGFGADATHTRANSKGLSRTVRGMSFPLQDPPDIRRNMDADAETAALFFGAKAPSSSLFTHFAKRAKQFLRIVP